MNGPSKATTTTPVVKPSTEAKPSTSEVVKPSSPKAKDAALPAKAEAAVEETESSEEPEGDIPSPTRSLALLSEALISNRYEHKVDAEVMAKNGNPPSKRSRPGSLERELGEESLARSAGPTRSSGFDSTPPSFSTTPAPGAAPSLSVELTTDTTAVTEIILPVPDPNPLELPGEIKFPQEDPLPLTSVAISPLVKHLFDLLVLDIGRWKDQYNLSNIATSFRQIKWHLDFEDRDRFQDLEALPFIDDSLRHVDRLFLNLHDAYLASANFYSRCTVLAGFIPQDHLPAFLPLLRHIQRDRIIVRHVLHFTASQIRRWMSRPSFLLTRLTNLIFQLPVPDRYASGIISEASLKTLEPGQWVDDNIINFFCGNREGHHLHVLGSAEDILFCSPLIWSTIAALPALGSGLGDKIFNRETLLKIRRIIMPYHEKDHWILIHCNVRTSKIEVLDSLWDQYHADTAASKAKRFARPVRLTRVWIDHIRTRFNLSLSAACQWNIVAPVEEVCFSPLLFLFIPHRARR
ncbi:hypothetical protein ONZ45_g19632 [Pleurotus djamor]|nr:hypothetical protein ONZ45_g19632 [Pleurotus djamor]